MLTLLLERSSHASAFAMFLRLASSSLHKGWKGMSDLHKGWKGKRVNQGMAIFISKELASEFGLNHWFLKRKTKEDWLALDTYGRFECVST